jgi:hypothetical protein
VDILSWAHIDRTSEWMQKMSARSYGQGICNLLLATTKRSKRRHNLPLIVDKMGLRRRACRIDSSIITTHHKSSLLGSVGSRRFLLPLFGIQRFGGV